MIAPATLYVLAFACLAGLAQSDRVTYDWAGKGSAAAVNRLLQRVLQGDQADVDAIFELSVNASLCQQQPAQTSARLSQLCFWLLPPANAATKVRIVGTSGVDLAAGAGHYLRTHCNASIGWARAGGVQAPLAKDTRRFPKVKVSEQRIRHTDISYFANVVTFSYTLPWHDFADWEKLIDWMALSGVNLVLAYSGQEEVYRKVYESFGVNSSVFLDWSNGPAHLAWSRGQSSHGIAGPPTQYFLTKQWDLQRSILKRERELGITPVLPAFQGNVPPLMKALFPAANISVQGTGRHEAAWLDATDPLFLRIGRAVVRQMGEDFGAEDHWYAADGYFAAGNPPWMAPPHARQQTSSSSSSSSTTTTAARLDSRLALPAPTPAVDHSALVHAQRAYEAMASIDKDAIWLYQGWILDPNNMPVLNAFRAATPRGKFLVSDMWAEWNPIWAALQAADIPFLYGTLHNFGGNVGMWGNLNQLATGTKRAPSFLGALGSCANGLGGFPEGHDQNPVFYQYLFHMQWMQVLDQSDLNGTGTHVEPKVNTTSWMKQFARQRYGPHVTAMGLVAVEEAWQVLLREIYGKERPEPARGNTGMYREKARDALTASPLLGLEATPQPAWYNLSDVFRAWDLFTTAAATQAETQASQAGKGAGEELVESMSYDLVNVGREALATLSNTLFARLNQSSTAKQALERGQLLLALHADADALLCTDAGFSLGQWLTKARGWGNTTDDKDFLESVARAQPTTWLPACDPTRPLSAEAGGCGSESGLMDYANKQWGGLVSAFYSPRLQCFIDQAEEDLAAGSASLNKTAYYVRLDAQAWAFQRDIGGKRFPICWTPRGDAVQLSRQLIRKYWPTIQP